MMPERHRSDSNRARKSHLKKNTICGMARSSNTLFEPIRWDSAPHKTLPAKAPRQMSDPDHDICSVVSGPDSKGVSKDFNSGSAGENQPTAQPSPSTTIFAKE